MNTEQRRIWRKANKRKSATATRRDTKTRTLKLRATRRINRTLARQGAALKAKSDRIIAKRHNQFDLELLKFEILQLGYLDWLGTPHPDRSDLISTLAPDEIRGFEALPEDIIYECS